MDDPSHMINYLLSNCTTSFHPENADINNDTSVNMDDLGSMINKLLQE